MKYLSLHNDWILSGGVEAVPDYAEMTFLKNGFRRGDTFSDGLNRYAAENACVASGRHTLPWLYRVGRLKTLCVAAPHTLHHHPVL